MKISQSRNCWF